MPEKGKAMSGRVVALALFFILLVVMAILVLWWSPWSGAIKGFVFLDANINKAYDSGDTRLESIEVFIKRDSSGIVQDTFTNSNGEFGFPGVPNGTYEVYVRIPQEPFTIWTQTVPVDSSIHDVTVSMGGTVDEVMFGLVPDHNSSCEVVEVPATPPGLFVELEVTITNTTPNPFEYAIEVVGFGGMNGVILLSTMPSATVTNPLLLTGPGDETVNAKFSLDVDTS
ncbi:MAG: hypothetical protein KDI79_20060, partial [Anaerolineae bacterium]|nr:hypothetical protein [Anaerolineae bacterium]